jgi:transcriptional regulator with XRE-family HTH domain
MNRLRILRNEKGYTQIKIQMLAGIEQSDYSKLENGKHTYTFEQCKRLALVFNTSMDYLAGCTDVQEPHRRSATCLSPYWKRPSSEDGGDVVLTRLRTLRLQKGYTQIKMQMLTGIDQSAYSKIERGIRYLSFGQCKRVALALDTSMDYLAGLTDDSNPYPRNASLTVCPK